MAPNFWNHIGCTKHKEPFCDDELGQRGFNGIVQYCLRINCHYQCTWHWRTHCESFCGPYRQRCLCAILFVRKKSGHCGFLSHVVSSWNDSLWSWSARVLCLFSHETSQGLHNQRCVQHGGHIRIGCNEFALVICRRHESKTNHILERLVLVIRSVARHVVCTDFGIWSYFGRKSAKYYEWFNPNSSFRNGSIDCWRPSRQCFPVAWVIVCKGNSCTDFLGPRVVIPNGLVSAR